MTSIRLGEHLLAEMYRSMLRIRRFEEKLSELYAGGMTHGSLHLYIGEEAVAVGICANLRKDDFVTSTHRGHGHCIAKGAPMDRLMAEFMGRRDGLCGGRGGSMHVFDLSVGILGTNGIVGAGIPIAVGAGLSARVRRTDQVTACFFGDGASNQGTFHEGINMAAVWKLPVIFVCENNLYQVWARECDVTSVKNIADRATGYGIPGIIVDGCDVTKVYEAGRAAVQRARDGSGPTLIECKTYRWHGHHEGDPPDLVRSKEEIEEWKQKCPLKRLRATLVAAYGFSEERLRRIENEVTKEIAVAVKFAKESSFPSGEEAVKDVFWQSGELL